MARGQDGGRRLQGCLHEDPVRDGGDEEGGHPREAILSPTYSVLKLKQALGRVHRENSKTKSIQKLLYVAGTQEEDVVDSMGQKLENLTLINNGTITDDDLKIG